MPPQTLYWIRNDQRLDDNRVLTAFCKYASSGGIFASFMTKSLKRASVYRQRFYSESLIYFHEQLRAHEQKTLHFDQTFTESIKNLLSLYNIKAIFYSTESTTEEKQEESFLKSLAERFEISLFAFQQDSLLLKNDLPFAVKNLPEPFTKFRKIVEADLRILPPLDPPTDWPKALNVTNTPIEQIKKHLPNTPLTVPLSGGESAALHHLQNYFWQTDAAQTYKDTRNGLLDWTHSTKFSPWLATGNLSPRRIYKELQDYEDSIIKNDSTYWIFFELLWRDYFHFYAEQMGSKLFTKQKFEPSDTTSAHALFNNWCLGQTRDDFIDAHMTELLQTGWMSNRGRQNVASYLAKKINLPWSWGAQWFEKMLIDYDAANNWGNWSYFSGVGTDPRDRAFNTQTQAKHYDPLGEYQKKWLDKRSRNQAIFHELSLSSPKV